MRRFRAMKRFWKKVFFLFFLPNTMNPLARNPEHHVSLYSKTLEKMSDLAMASDIVQNRKTGKYGCLVHPTIRASVYIPNETFVWRRRHPKLPTYVHNGDAQVSTNVQFGVIYADGPVKAYSEVSLSCLRAVESDPTLPGPSKKKTEDPSFFDRRREAARQYDENDASNREDV